MCIKTFSFAVARGTVHLSLYPRRKLVWPQSESRRIFAGKKVHWKDYVLLSLAQKKTQQRIACVLRKKSAKKKMEFLCTVGLKFQTLSPCGL